MRRTGTGSCAPVLAGASRALARSPLSRSLEHRARRPAMPRGSAINGMACCVSHRFSEMIAYHILLAFFTQPEPIYRGHA
jgi:hypothetical protein